MAGASTALPPPLPQLLTRTVCVVVSWPLQLAALRAETTGAAPLAAPPGGKKRAGEPAPAAEWAWPGLLTQYGALAASIVLNWTETAGLARRWQRLLAPLFRRLPLLCRGALTPLEAGQLLDRATRYPVAAVVVLAMVRAGSAAGSTAGPSSLREVAARRVRRHGVASLWAGFLPAAAGAMLAGAWGNRAGGLLLDACAPASTAGKMAAVITGRLLVQAALQPLFLMSKHMLVTADPFGDAACALLRRRGAWGLWAGAPERAAQAAVFYATAAACRAALGP